MIITSDPEKKCYSCPLLTVSLCPVDGTSISPAKYVTTVARPNRRLPEGQTALRAMGEIADNAQSLRFLACRPSIRGTAKSSNSPDENRAITWIPILGIIFQKTACSLFLLFRARWNCLWCFLSLRFLFSDAFLFPPGLPLLPSRPAVSLSAA